MYDEVDTGGYREAFTATRKKCRPNLAILPQKIIVNILRS